MRAAPRQPSKQWSKSRCATSPSMPGCGTRRVGRPLASFSQRSVSSMCSRLREPLREVRVPAQPHRLRLRRQVGQRQVHLQRVGAEHEALAQVEGERPVRRRAHGGSAARPRWRWPSSLPTAAARPRRAANAGCRRSWVRSCSRGRASGSGGSPGGWSTARAGSSRPGATRSARRARCCAARGRSPFHRPAMAPPRSGRRASRRSPARSSMMVMGRMMPHRARGARGDGINCPGCRSRRRRRRRPAPPAAPAGARRHRLRSAACPRASACRR